LSHRSADVTCAICNQSAGRGCKKEAP
jgi:hypothetical protein